MSNEWMPIPQVLINSMDHDPVEFKLLYMRHIEGDIYHLLGEEEPAGEGDDPTFFCRPWCGYWSMSLYSGFHALDSYAHEFGFKTIEEAKRFAIGGEQ